MDNEENLSPNIVLSINKGSLVKTLLMLRQEGVKQIEVITDNFAPQVKIRILQGVLEGANRNNQQSG